MTLDYSHFSSPTRWRCQILYPNFRISEAIINLKFVKYGPRYFIVDFESLRAPK